MSERVLTLPEDGSLKMAESVHRAWLEATEDAPNTIILDASRAERVSCALVQLIIGLDQTLRAAGKTLHIREPGEAVRHAFGALGLQSYLEERTQ